MFFRNEEEEGDIAPQNDTALAADQPTPTLAGTDCHRLR